MIIYRRSEEEMPARIEEVKHAKEEGVEVLTLHNPIEYIADEQGKVKQVVLQKMEPVSYTHLDVYKRQGRASIIRFMVDRTSSFVLSV